MKIFEVTFEETTIYKIPADHAKVYEDVQRAMFKQKDGTFTFNLRVVGSKITDLVIYEYSDAGTDEVLRPDGEKGDGA